MCVDECSKFDLNGGRSYGKYETAIGTLDDILIQEIAILKPKVCLFVTGAAFDSRLKGIFDGATFEARANFNVREFAQVKHPLLPEFTFRSYPPKYIRLKGMEEPFLQFIKTLHKE